MSKKKSKSQKVQFVFDDSGKIYNLSKFTKSHKKAKKKYEAAKESLHDAIMKGRQDYSDDRSMKIDLTETPLRSDLYEVPKVLNDLLVMMHNMQLTPESFACRKRTMVQQENKNVLSLWIKFDIPSSTLKLRGDLLNLAACASPDKMENEALAAHFQVNMNTKAEQFILILPISPDIKNSAGILYRAVTNASYLLKYGKWLFDPDDHLTDISPAQSYKEFKAAFHAIKEHMRLKVKSVEMQVLNGGSHIMTKTESYGPMDQITKEPDYELEGNSDEE